MFHFKPEHYWLSGCCFENEIETEDILIDEIPLCKIDESDFSILLNVIRF